MKRRILQLFFLTGIHFFANAQYSWWQENPQTFSRLRNVNFPDNSTGWIFGDSSDINGFVTGIIKKTTDQGQTWSSQIMGSSNFRIYSSYFFNISSGVAVGRNQLSGQGVVMRTSDGGNTWIADSVSIPQRLFDVDFSTVNLGWVSGRNGYLAKTADGGINWVQQTTGTPAHLFSLDFTDSTYGWAVGADPGPGGTIIRTMDGGINWVLQTNTTPNDLMSVYAFNQAKAIAVGFAGTIVLTSDSGNTWSPVTSGTPEDLFDVKFTDSLHGWIVGTAGTILTSSDGGLTWGPQASNTTNVINSICMKDTTLGWYCGDNGSVYFYGFSPASVNEFNVDESISVFPNPSIGLFSVTSKKGKIKNIAICNSIGENVAVLSIENSSFSIDLQNLSGGIYFICFETEDGESLYKKVIIQ